MIMNGYNNDRIGTNRWLVDFSRENDPNVWHYFNGFFLGFE
jgi:hypothetical protein